MGLMGHASLGKSIGEDRSSMDDRMDDRREAIMKKTNS